MMSDETTRHPDIEIYIKSRSLEQILAWLEQLSESPQAVETAGSTHHLSCIIKGQTIPVMIHERALGKAWTSLWFRSDATPWERDLDCAEEASQALDTQVRCIVSGWEDGDDPDEWWRIENGNTEKISWRTE